MSRMPKERMDKALAQLKTISREDYAKVKGLAAIVRPLRSVLFKTPDEYGMTGWKDLVIPSDDGIPLEAWYIPAKGGESNKLIIFNHALPMCRAGFPGHLGEPWSQYDAVEIDFVIQYKHLTDAGYNVLTYDIRNPRQQQRRQRRTQRDRPMGMAGLRRGETVCGSTPQTRQDDRRPLQPVHGRQLAIPRHSPPPGAVRQRPLYGEPHGRLHGGHL
jgi:hypothetical protein